MRYLLFLLALGPASLFAAEPLYKSIDTPPAPELTPQQALKSFSIAPGFEVTLVAAEPLVEDPVAVTWDETGVMYVVEMRGYMPDVFGNGKDEPVGMVVQLEDINSDGIYDKRTVLLDKLILPRAVAVVNEGLLIGEPPNLWLCPKSSGASGRFDCQQKVRLGDFGSREANVEHDENGMLQGIDNWIYNAKSGRRFKIDDGKVISEPTIPRGQWGITANNSGTLYYNTNANLLMGDLYDAQPIVNAGNTSAAGLNIPVSQDDKLYAIRVNTGVNRAYVPGVLRADGRLNRPTSASGMSFYRGDQFPLTYRGDVFVTEPAANAVVQLKLKEGPLSAQTEHVLYKDQQWGQREFMASTDERFRPVDAKVGPDGALYVIDMYRGIIQDTMFMSEELREQILARSLDKPLGMGRIWRIRHTSGKTQNTEALSTHIDELIATLSDENGWRRDTAQRLLLASEESDVNERLVKIVAEDTEWGGLHALWTLEGRNALNVATIQTALMSDHSATRLAALRAGQSQLSTDQLLQLSRSENASIAHHALMYAKRFNNDPRVIERLASAALEAQANPVRLAGVYAGIAGNELGLAAKLIDSGQWTQTAEGNARFIEGLFTQALRGRPDQSSVYLDFIAQANQPWVQEAALRGLQEGARGEGFERIVLPAPHSVFDNSSDAMWSEVSRTRKLFTWPDDDLPPDTMPLSPDDFARKELGKTYFEQRCAICHGNDGKGIGAIGPPLVGASWVTGPTERLARIVLQGVKGEIDVLGKTWNSVMPGHANIQQFDNEIGAGLMTYLHRAWGHSGRVISPQFFGEIRDMEADRRSQWTADELMSIDTNTHYRDYTGVYGGGAFEVTLSYDGSGLNIASVYFNGPVTEITEGTFLFKPRDFTFEVISDKGVVTGIKVPLQGGSILPRVSR